MTLALGIGVNTAVFSVVHAVVLRRFALLARQPYIGRRRDEDLVAMMTRLCRLVASAMLSSKLVKGSTLKVYRGPSHGMCTINADQINSDRQALCRALGSPRGTQPGFLGHHTSPSSGGTCKSPNT